MPGTFPQRGEIHLVRLPGHPLDRKRRPAIVVSLDVRNQWAHDVIVVPLSTTLRPLPTHVMIPAGAGGLRHTSMAKCEQVTTLTKSLVGLSPLGGKVPEELMAQIEQGIMRAIGLVV